MLVHYGRHETNENAQVWNRSFRTWNDRDATVTVAMDLNDYLYFVHVVEKRGFTAASRSLGIPKSRLSRHINQLEERLEARLQQPD